ncbi:MAG: class I tRNA ligase family protein, partial [Candidatus Delongbacteria bacterium]|nr:class I tRNA ligase family protein [Candidatus Delongbacteria bacterium]
AMPYAQNHYPFENKERVEKNFPADFIAEGIDQTRGWFNKLLVLSTMLFNKPAFSNVIVNGIVLAEDGSKMSKSKKNFPPVMDTLNKFGADAMRMYLINSPAVKAENLRFSENGVKEVIKKVMLPLWNSYSFLIPYAKIDNWKPKDKYLKPEDLTNKLDKWIMSSLQSLTKDVNEQMSAYKLYNVLPAMVGFIDDLTNWYIRRSKRRFWKSENDVDKYNAYETLYEVLSILTKLIAPVMPFIAEKIYQNLELSVFPDSKKSVHLCDFPEVDESFINTKLEEEMAFVQTVVKLGRILRNDKNIKIRQALQSITVVANRDVTKKAVEEMKDLILEELNIKEVLMTEKEDELVEVITKANFRVIGKKYGKKVKDIAAQISKLSLADIRKIESGEAVEVCEEKIVLEDVFIQHNQKEGVFSASEGDITVSLDIRITPELLSEGHAREIINRIQNLRKDNGFEISDRIIVRYSTDQILSEAIISQTEYISNETLSVEIKEDGSARASGVEMDINGHICYISVERV